MPPRWFKPTGGCLKIHHPQQQAWLHRSPGRLFSNSPPASRARSPHDPSIPNRRNFNVSTSVYNARSSQRHDVDDYYAELLAQPLPASAATERPVAAPPATPRSELAVPLDPAEQTPAQRAAIVFGSRLLPPNVRKANLEEAQARGEGQWLAGHWIPPRPPEPDNCCMSGCVNCVWDVYREDIEEWVATRAAARAADRKLKAAKANEQMAQGIEGDDDGVASGAGLNPLGLSDGEEGVENLMSDIPVGIREFMKTEKMLRERHRQEAQASA